MVNNPPNPHEPIPGDTDVAQLARVIREETDALLALLPDAFARQWEASPVPKPREDTTERSSGGRPSDPTADTVLDGRRLALRGATSRAERVLQHAAQALTERRTALARALDRYDGEGSR